MMKCSKADLEAYIRSIPEIEKADPVADSVEAQDTIGIIYEMDFENVPPGKIDLGEFIEIWNRYAKAN